MIYLGTITSQGQLTIPVALRNLLGLNKSSKVSMSVKDDKLLIEPTRDILEFHGAFAKYAKKNKGKTVDEIIASEKKVFEEAIVEKYGSKRK